MTAARIAPDQYVSKLRKPSDFDDFWHDVLEQASNIPLDPEVVLDPLRSSEEVEVFEVFYNSLDRVRIAGWYCLPRDRRGLLPAILQVPGYLMEPPIPKNWASNGYAAFSVAPRGKLRSNRQFNPGFPGLHTYSMVDRNTSSYRGFYVDAWRAVDFLMPRDEADQRTHRGSRQQPGRRPDHHHGSHAARSCGGFCRRALPVWVHGRQ